MTDVIEKHIEVAKLAATQAATVIRKYYSQGVEVRLKADQSPVTQADLESEKVIKETLQSAFPDYGFYGEETGGESLEADYVWLVDPIDGTKSFVRGYPFFSTQIALMHKKQIILGVSSAPLFEELAWAYRDRGAFLNDTRISVSDVAQLSDATLSFGNISSLAKGDRWGDMGQLIQRVNRIRGYGDFYHYHLLASGKIDVVVESDVNILDIAALSCIVIEAGGTFTELDGGPINLETVSVLATNGSLNDALASSF